MLESVKDLRSAADGTVLNDLNFELFDIPDTDGTVFAVRLKGVDPFEAWQAARAIIDSTGRWPLLVDLAFSSFGGIKEKLMDGDLSRFPFEDEDGNAQSPAKIIEASKAVDVDAWFEAQGRDFDKFEEDYDWVVEELESEFGRRPEESELDKSIPFRVHRYERWAWDRQREAGTLASPEEGRQRLFEPQKPALLLMPTAKPWETLAWASWYGAEQWHAETVAVIRDWTERYGAELFANLSTMLEFVVTNPPTEPEDAWQLATRHDLLAPSTLAGPGITVRQYAQALIGWDRWFLHERP
ncbi:MAG: DUF4253 domain-containing protein [Woeseiaceae bacterium]|nr:DUF4253 domain-containing protein [Woeseiaceae bacterium]